MADEFAEALGQFCWNFSITEATVRSTLYRVMRVTPNVGNAALSGMTFNAMMLSITKLSEAQKWPVEKTKEWTYIRCQLGSIATLRNHILHYGAYKLGTDYVVSNQQVIHIPERLSAIKISRQTLLDASDDLAQAGARINLLFHDLPQEHVEHLRKALTSSWRYKQPPQAWSKGKTPNTPPKPQSPSEKHTVRA
jgi:hypothetical protein